MDQLKRMLLLAAVLCFGAIPAHAQFIGYTSPQTVSQAVFPSGTSCANFSSGLQSAPLQNVGQSVHVVSFSLSSVGPVSGSNGVIVRIMGSADGLNFYQLSDDGMSIGNSGVLVGYGSYPFVEVWVLNGTAGCEVSANYTGTSVSPPNSVGATDSTAYAKLLLATFPANGNQSALGVTTPYGTTAGFVVVSSALNGGPPAGSSIGISIGSIAGNKTIASYSLSTTNLPQIFAIPSVGSSSVGVSYTSGGTSSNFLTISYIFTKPGVSNEPLCEKTVVMSFAVQGPNQIIAGGTGYSARICSIAISSGTAESVDFQQGTGSNCATGNSQLTGLYHMAANSPLIHNFPQGGLVGGMNNAICVHISGANQTDGTITYSQY